ncbi:Hpt domain-containing protein [Pseudotabrizicola algicola]|uniref:Hpt domain-containing protein n=1 Tax=Pseudotabrizicola algicola TaxID=2709381 RepID=UPI00339007A9
MKDLRSEIGVEDFGEIVTVFLQEADEVVSRLITLTDARSIENDLHFLKGSALNLGFADLALICQSGERRAASGFTDVCTQAVVDSYQRSRSAFLGGIEAIFA